MLQYEQNDLLPSMISNNQPLIRQEQFSISARSQNDDAMHHGNQFARSGRLNASRRMTAPILKAPHLFHEHVDAQVLQQHRASIDMAFPSQHHDSSVTSSQRPSTWHLQTMNDPQTPFSNNNLHDSWSSQPTFPSQFSQMAYYSTADPYCENLYSNVNFGDVSWFDPTMGDELSTVDMHSQEYSVQQQAATLNLLEGQTRSSYDQGLFNITAPGFEQFTTPLDGSYFPGLVVEAQAAGLNEEDDSTSQDEPDLVGLGLYDDPKGCTTSMSQLDLRSNFQSQGQSHAGKGLKLEETWQPPDETPEVEADEGPQTPPGDEQNMMLPVAAYHNNSDYQYQFFPNNIASGTFFVEGDDASFYQDPRQQEKDFQQWYSNYNNAQWTYPNDGQYFNQ